MVRGKKDGFIPMWVGLFHQADAKQGCAIFVGALG